MYMNNHDEGQNNIWEISENIELFRSKGGPPLRTTLIISYCMPETYESPKIKFPQHLEETNNNVTHPADTLADLG